MLEIFEIFNRNFWNKWTFILRSSIKVFSITIVKNCSRKASLIFWKTAWKHLWRSTPLNFLQMCFSWDKSRYQEHHFYKMMFKCFFGFVCLLVWSVSVIEIWVSALYNFLILVCHSTVRVFPFSSQEFVCFVVFFLCLT